MSKHEAINHFLLVYDRAIGHLLEVAEFGTDCTAAIKRYQELERQHAANNRMDIVLVGSDSLETIKVTHANYFAEGVTTIRQAEAYLRSFNPDSYTRR